MNSRVGSDSGTTGDDATASEIKPQVSVLKGRKEEGKRRGWIVRSDRGVKRTKGVAILLEELKKGLSDLLRGPDRTRSVGGHSRTGEREGWWYVRRMEGSGTLARKDMSQSQVPPQNPRNPHRKQPRADNERALLSTPRFRLVTFL